MVSRWSITNVQFITSLYPDHSSTAHHTQYPLRTIPELSTLWQYEQETSTNNIITSLSSFSFMIRQSLLLFYDYYFSCFFVFLCALAILWPFFFLFFCFSLRDNWLLSVCCRNDLLFLFFSFLDLRYLFSFNGYY